MLKDLVRERLIAAADEIVGLFETAIASYEEQLCRAREETKRHRQQLEAVCKTQVVVRMEDVQRLISHHAHHPRLREHPQRPLKEEKEASAIMLPLAGESVQECKEEPAELPHHSRSGDQRGESAPEDRQDPLSQNKNIEENKALRSNADRKDVQQLDCQEHPPLPQGESSILGQKDAKPIHVKVEPAALQFPHVGEEEAEVGTFPLTAVSEESEDDQDKAPKWSQLHHDSPSGDHHGGPPPDGLIAPLSDNDDIEHLRSNTDCEGDNKQWKCSEKEKICNKNKIRIWKKGFPCSVCGKCLTTKSRLQQHMRTHTSEKPFNCSVCGKKFSLKHVLINHMKTHTGDKPFSCSICWRKFSRNPNLVRHMITHTGEKRFSCPVCGKKLSQKHVIVTHMRIHTGEKPFSCSVCGREFTQKQHLVKHMRTHKAEKPS
ncbi:uncharacterized protein LOC144003249 [Festucalex cinctus]